MASRTLWTGTGSKPKPPIPALRPPIPPPRARLTCRQHRHPRSGGRSHRSWGNAEHDRHHSWPGTQGHHIGRRARQAVLFRGLQAPGAGVAGHRLHLQLHRPHDHRHHRPGHQGRPEDLRHPAGPPGRALFRPALHPPGHPHRALRRAVFPGQHHLRRHCYLVGVHRALRLRHQLLHAGRVPLRRRGGRGGPVAAGALADQRLL